MPTNPVAARIEALKRKLAAREGKPEFKDNCDEIRAELERLQSGEQSA
jgi:hypothetical protein